VSICKNAIEYEKILNRLQAEFLEEVRQKESEISKKYRHSLNNAEGMEWKTLHNQLNKEISDLYHECMKPIENFIKRTDQGSY